MKRSTLNQIDCPLASKSAALRGPRIPWPLGSQGQHPPRPRAVLLTGSALSALRMALKPSPTHTLSMRPAGAYPQVGSVGRNRLFELSRASALTAFRAASRRRCRKPRTKPFPVALAASLFHSSHSPFLWVHPVILTRLRRPLNSFSARSRSVRPRFGSRDVSLGAHRF